MVLVAAAVATPRSARALERETRTGPASGVPLVVGTTRFAQLWIDLATTFDLAPTELTLSDGTRWQRDAATPRWDVSAGGTIGRFTGAVEACAYGLGTAAQLDLLRGERRRLAITATARAVYGGGWDVSLVPAWSARLASGPNGVLVAFAAARFRGGQTLYAVQGPDGQRSSPYAEVVTNDVALAPMAGAAALWRWAELRVTAGWEAFLVDRVDWEQRPSYLSRSGGPFFALALRARLGGPQ